MREEVSGYGGPHKVVLNRNAQNLGLAGNNNRAWELSSGEFIVMQAGDDLSLPARTTELVNAWQCAGNPAHLVCSYHQPIDIHGEPCGDVWTQVVWASSVREAVAFGGCTALGCTAGYAREIHAKYGPLDPRILMEDWVYPFRAMLESRVAVVRQPLVQYRHHSSSLAAAYFSEKRGRPKRLPRLRAHRLASSKLAVAEDWKRAWNIRGLSDPVLEAELERLVAFRKLQEKGYSLARVARLSLVWQGMRSGLSTRQLAGLAREHVLQRCY